ncbi:hypothetical protein HK098_004566 [Nowakowskiella sp. JEL0407]|nr:hypothetical protein HK098_004566 [Nowakowskiella sp. JEL0407]
MSQTIRYFIKIIEDAKRSGKFNDRVFLILDRLDMKKENLDPELMRTMITTFNTHYPERLDSAFIFPTSYILTLGWTMIKSFLDHQQTSRVKMFTEKEFMSEVLCHIEREKLLVRYGGGLEEECCYDARGVSLVSFDLEHEDCEGGKEKKEKC